MIDEIGRISKLVEQIGNLHEDAFHLSQYFPEDSDETVTFTAGGVANTFGVWVEIVDNNAVTLSSIIAACYTHISSVIVEDVSVTDKIYIFEISYGVSNIVVLRGRILSGTTLQDTLQQGRRRVLTIPVGEAVYYRLKCETAGATLQVALRYHCH